MRYAIANAPYACYACYTGLRPGEKWYEELFHLEEKLGKTTHSKILLAAPRSNHLVQVAPLMNALKVASDNYSEEEIQMVLEQLVPEMTVEKL